VHRSLAGALNSGRQTHFLGRLMSDVIKIRNQIVFSPNAHFVLRRKHALWPLDSKTFQGATSGPIWDCLAVAVLAIFNFAPRALHLDHLERQLARRLPQVAPTARQWAKLLCPKSPSRPAGGQSLAKLFGAC